jgi:heme exporter protein D
MYFDSIAAVMDMDGHGVYVWLAYAITVVLLFWLFWVPARQLRVRKLWLVAEEQRRNASEVLRSEATRESDLQLDVCSESMESPR